MPLPPRGISMSAEQAMKLAIELSKEGAPFVSPNPRVGCVILDSKGGFLSAGFHERFGGPHAEVNAVRGLTSEDLKGAQAFVTLEPCAHEGKTPSCAKMLARLPLGKVVYGLQDPNPLVSGQGAQIVRAAGISCEAFPGLQAELEESCEAFLWNFRHQQCFVSLKVAASLDGKVALANGESKWITGEESRLEGHWLRAGHDAILVGSGTVVADDPTLDVRVPGIEKRNKVVVLDSQGRLLKEFSKWRLVQARRPEEIFWVVSESAALSALPSGVQILRVPSVPLLDLSAVLKSLRAAGIHSVLVEGGAQVAGSFLKQGLVNRLHLFQAPLILGQGRSWSEELRFDKLSSSFRGDHLQVQRCGSDMHFRLLLRDPMTGRSLKNG